MNSASDIEAKLQELYPNAYVVVLSHGWPYAVSVDIVHQKGEALEEPDMELVQKAFGDKVTLLGRISDGGNLLRYEATS